jgi:hypothetical protein
MDSHALGHACIRIGKSAYAPNFKMSYRHAPGFGEIVLYGPKNGVQLRIKNVAT